jgi:3-oxoacyl-[acyl-carrier protein] reductase
MSETLAGKSCLITGAAGGVGREISKILAAEGVDLFITSRGKGELTRLTRELSAGASQVSMFPCNLTDLGEVDALYEQVSDVMGSPDFLVNAAGVGKFGKIGELSPEVLGDLLQVNVVAPYAIVRKFLPGMVERESGTIVNISSIAGVYAYPNCSAYSASKAALIGFSRSLREELMPHGIRVFTICPSSVNTSFMDNVQKHIPREKMLKPEDVAGVVVRLLSHPERVVEEEIVLRPMAFRPYI